MKDIHLLYPFPESFPLAKARGIQVANTLIALAKFPLKITFAYVPVPEFTDPFSYYSLKKPDNIFLLPLSRSLAFPFSKIVKIRSGFLFFHRLEKWVSKEVLKGSAPIVFFARHLKLSYQLLKKFPKIPLVFEAHEIFSETTTRQKKTIAEIEEYVLIHAETLIVITRALGELLNESYALDRVPVVVPSATNIEKQKIEKNWSEIKSRIIYCGSFFDWKGAEDLFNAAPLLPGYEITFIGGEDNIIEEWQRKIAPFNTFYTGALINFYGHLSHQDVQEHLYEACIAVLPNRPGSISKFTSPLKLFEYMAAGCAIVASDLPIFNEVLQKKQAVWFPSGNVQALATVIKKLAESPSHAATLSETMQQLAKNYTWQARAEKIFQILKKIS